MIKPELYDVVEIITELPEYNLHAGTRGTVVLQYSDEDFEIEFEDEEGNSLAICTLPLHQFIVVWQANGEHAVSITDQIAQIVSRLPNEVGSEVLDFARFLSMRANHSS